MLSLHQHIVVEITEMLVLQNAYLICGFPESGRDSLQMQQPNKKLGYARWI